VAWRGLADSHLFLTSRVPLCFAVVQDTPFPSFCTELIPLLTTHISGSPSDLSPEQLSLVLGLRKVVLGKKPEGSAGEWPSVLSSKAFLNCGTVGEFLLPLQASSYTFPAIHTVWAHVFKLVFASDGTVDNAMLKDVWKEVVETGLLNSTHERRGLAFLLFDYLVPKVEAHQLTFLLSAQFVRCLMNNLSSEENYLFKQAEQTLGTIISTAEVQMDRRVSVISALIGAGDLHFDRTTKSKTVQKLQEGMDATALEQYSQVLQKSILCPAKSSEALDEDEAAELIKRQRIMAIDALYSLASKTPKYAPRVRSFCV
jgi:hypothetical protein